MSKFADIASAYGKFAQTNDWSSVNYGLIYTCNCGWVDLGHLNPNSSRAGIGAANLWRALRSEGPAVLRASCTLKASNLLQVPGVMAAKYLSGCSQDAYMRFDDGKTGFFVRYRQDHGGYPGRPGSEGQYLVKQGLTDMQKQSIALSIFTEVSHAFEGFQSGFPGALLTDSGYSAEDLVSNLIGFYIAVGAITKSAAIEACRPVSQATAENIWTTYGAVGSNKNTSFEPHLFDSGMDDPKAAVCRDECGTAARRFPDVFKTIRPATLGRDFLRLGSGPLLLLAN